MLREETEQLIKNLYENLEKANKQAACPYDIGMSVGCAQFTKEVRTIPDLVNSADEDMYLRKEQNVLICKFRIDEKETISYPICSVVAVFKMFVRILS